MKKSYFIFFKKLLVVLLILIVADLALGMLLEHYYLKMRTGQSARITYAMTKANEELLIFGSSRANHNYVPDILEDSFQLRAYNAGVDGQGILYHYCILKSIQLRTQPKIIVLDLNLNEFENAAIGYDKLYALLPYYNSHKIIRPTVNLRSSYEPVKAISNLYRYNSFILPILFNNIASRADDSKKGYLPLFKNMSSIAKPASLHFDKLDTVKVNIFRSFVREAAKANCKVFVFVSPIFKNNTAISSTLTLADQICKEEHVSFINHADLPFFNDHPELFQDALHLNDNGARIYTGIIAAEIKKTSF